MQDYNNTDQRIHQLSQVIAKANRTFVPKKPDDSHTNLFFDPISHRIYGRWVEVEDKKIILAINLKDFTFEWLDDQLQIINSYGIQGRTMSDIEQYLEQSLPEIGLKKEGFRDKLHFVIPVYSFLNEPFESFDLKSRENWEYYRGMANVACSDLLGNLQVDGEIRIWPHHFDTGIYVEPNNNTGLGFGLAMKDGLVGSPYYYFSGYRLNGGKFDYTKIADLRYGKWIISNNWNGAVLPLSELKKDNPGIIPAYLKEASQWFLTK
jgi:hypothetical protein